MEADLKTRIRALREAAGLTQRELAIAVGLTDKSSVAKWESGVSAPPARRMPEVARALGVSIAELYGEAA